MNAVDSREVVFLVMLDLSATYDTIDHGILLHCLQNNFGIAGNVLRWIKSYFESRTYQVQIDGIFSHTYDLEYGVLQGSVLGPLGFILNTSPVGNIICKHGLKFHVYADDTQIYVSFSPRSPGACRAALRQLKVGVNPSLKKVMWLIMHLITKKTCTKMYKSIHFWNQKSQMNPMVATDFCKIIRFSRNSSVTMVTIEFFLDSITKIWFY